jgi:hypothetical protein
MSALRVDSCATHQAIKLKVLWEELNPELLLELLEFEASKILGEDISSVIFGGDMIQHNLFNCYAFMHIMIFTSVCLVQISCTGLDPMKMLP